VIQWLGQVASSHVTARAAIVQGLREVLGREPTLLEAQFAQAVACVETGGAYDATYYTNRLTGEQIRGTHNWGAAHCRESPPCPPGCFEATDVGQNCFIRYASQEEGVRGLIQVLYVNRRGVLAAAGSGDVRTFATALKQSRYYTATIEDYAASLEGCLNRIARALGETAPRSRGISLRALLPPLLIAGAGVALFWGTLKTPVKRTLSRLTR
jgi:hypothetical protein